MRVGVELDTAASYPASEGVDRNDHHRVTGSGVMRPGRPTTSRHQAARSTPSTGPRSSTSRRMASPAGESTTAPWAARAPAPMVRSTSIAPTSANVTRAVSRTSRAAPPAQPPIEVVAQRRCRGPVELTGDGDERGPRARQALAAPHQGEGRRQRRRQRHGRAGVGWTRAKRVDDAPRPNIHVATLRPAEPPGQGSSLVTRHTEGRSPCRDLPGSRVAAAGTATP